MLHVSFVTAFLDFPVTSPLLVYWSIFGKDNSHLYKSKNFYFWVLLILSFYGVWVYLSLSFISTTFRCSGYHKCKEEQNESRLDDRPQLGFPSDRSVGPS